MSSQTYILTGKTRAALEKLIADLPTVPADQIIESAMPPAVTVTPGPHLLPKDEPSPFPARALAMRDYPPPPADIVEVLGAAIVSWERTAGSGLHSIDEASTFRACAWELRQILNDFNAKAPMKEQN